MANKTKHRSVPSKAAPVQAAVSAPKVGVRAFSQEFKPDYTPVKEDLKRIAYLAGIFLIILVVLSFFLR